MSFLYPQFLWALLALLIPVIIHLFHFRRYKTVYFSNLRFLKNLQEETKQQQKLKHLLVLLCRLIAIACLVLAFAQPYIRNKQPSETGAKQAISVFIDNSFSMTHSGSSGELLEQAKSKARELANLYGNSVKFQLLTQDFEARHQRLVSKSDFLQCIDEVKPTFASHRISHVLIRQQQALSKAPDTRKSIYLISDFQESQADAEEWKNDSTVSLNLIPLRAATPANVSIDSCWFISPYIPLQQPVQLMVRIRNAGDNPISNNSLLLKINNEQRAVSGFDIQPNTYTDITLSFTVNKPGYYAAELSITDHPVTFDDKLFFSFNVRESVQVLHIFQQTPSANVRAVFASDPFCKTREVSEKQIDYSLMNQTDVVVLDGVSQLSSGFQNELTRFVQSGGSVVLLPPAGTKEILRSHVEWLRNEGIRAEEQIIDVNEPVHTLHTSSEVLDGVFEKTPRNPDMPKVMRYYRLNIPGARFAEPVLSLKNDDAIWSMYKRGKGRIYVSAVPVEQSWSSLPDHALFVPLMLKTAYLSETKVNLYYSLQDVGANLPFQPTEQENTVTVSDEKQSYILPVERNGSRSIIYFNGQLQHAGIYTVPVNRETNCYLGINYSRDESSNRFLTPDELLARHPGLTFNTLDDTKKPLSTVLAEQQAGSRLWKVCVVLALVFLLIEILLLKFYRP
jgi:hypothetical protein